MNPYLAESSSLERVVVKDGVRVHLMTAVAKPLQVRDTLAQCVHAIDRESFHRDHAHFDLPPLREDWCVVITEKDWARMEFVSRQDVFVLRFEYQANEGAQAVFDQVCDRFPKTFQTQE